MNGKNQIVISGICAEPKLIGQNQNVMRFSVGVGRNQKFDAGTQKWTGETDWVKCLVFGYDSNIKKGAKIEICGQFRNNNWEKEGVKHWDYQVHVTMYRIFHKDNKNTPTTTPEPQTQDEENVGYDPAFEQEP